MIERVIATEVAESLIRGLRQRHGDVMFYLSHGCCDGSTPMCLKRGEMSLSEGDVQLGQVLGVPFHASRMQLDYLGDAQLTLDVRSGSLGAMVTKLTYGVRKFEHLESRRGFDPCGEWTWTRSWGHIYQFFDLDVFRLARQRRGK